MNNEKPIKVNTGYGEPEVALPDDLDMGNDIFDAPDEEMTPTPTKEKGTPFDLLRKALQKPVEDKFKVYSVPSRPGVGVMFNTAIDFDRVEIWRKRSEKGRGRNRELDALKFSTIVVANQATAFYMNGEEVFTPEGESITFRSPFVREWLGLPDIASPDLIIRTMYGVDGHLMAVADKIIEEAGYGEEANEDDENPTN